MFQLFPTCRAATIHLVAGVFATGLLASAALADSTVITFDTPDANAVANGVGFFNSAQAVSSIAEGGFTYSAYSGSLYLSGGTGNPGNDMEGDGAQGGGVLKIVETDGGAFKLSSVDFAAYDSRTQDGLGNPAAPGVLTVTGLLGGVTESADSYTLAAGGFSGGAGSFTPYTNWTTEAAVNLAGVYVDELLIQLNASNGDLGTGATFQSWSGVDNVSLIPEPASFGVVGLAMATLASLRARRRRV